jgi:ADP-ribose pyrophosphatase YjhB (NUDIX family)
MGPRARPRKKTPTPKHPMIKTASGRQLACYPTSVFGFVVDNFDRLLLFRQPGLTGWEVISGPMEAGETVPEAMIREIGEEAGPRCVTVYLGVIDTFTFVFDANLPPLVSVCCLMRYRGGEIEPGHDAKDADFQWWDLSRIDDIDLLVPKGRWDLLTKAVDLSRYLRDARPDEPGEETDSFGPDPKNSYLF